MVFMILSMVFMILYCKIPFRHAFQFRTATERCLMPKIIKLSVFVWSCIARYRSVALGIFSSRRNGESTKSLLSTPDKSHRTMLCGPFLACVRSPIKIPGRSPGTTLNIAKIIPRGSLTDWWQDCTLPASTAETVWKLEIWFYVKTCSTNVVFVNSPQGGCSLRVGSKLSKTLPNCLGYLLC